MDESRSERRTASRRGGASAASGAARSPMRGSHANNARSSNARSGNARSGAPVGGRPSGTASGGDERRGGSRLAPKSVRLPEPAIDPGVTGKELDRAIWAQLRTLSQENAVGVAQHLVMVARLLDENIVAAEAHAETAVRRAGRVAAAREALGIVAYRRGDWARALAEFRTVRRLSGSSHLLPFMVDCERALGRPERALELAAGPESRGLTQHERVELAIVVSGIRRDLGQAAAAAAGLEIPELAGSATTPWAARLRYAYAEAQLALGHLDRARDWFARAIDADTEVQTDAAERLDELDGVAFTDLDEQADGDEGNVGRTATALGPAE